MAGTIRESAANNSYSDPQSAPVSEALSLMVEALRLIDASGGGAIAGAHLDLAIHSLREWIESSKIR